MDANAEKTALRMIPYGLYVLMAFAFFKSMDDVTLTLKDLGERTFYGR